MDLTIQTSSNEKLLLQPGIPPGVTAMRIPGSTAWSAEGEHGTILFEELHTGPFTLRFTFFKLFKKMTLHCRMQNPFVGTRVALKNNWRFILGDAGEMKLHENQFSLYHLNGRGEKIVFEKDKEYRSFDAFCSADKIDSLVSIFPGLAEFAQKAKANDSAFLARKAHWSAPETMDIIREIRDCPYEGSMREYYLEHRLEELLFLLLMLAFKKEPEEQTPSDQEIAAAHAAEKMIMADITQHYSIPAIAKKVHLNEFRLKYVFKHIFKTGIFEYLLQARMQEAKRLLTNTNKPIKEIASLTGYQRLTSFITAFRKHFGYTPGSVRRS
jgi:AraC-like DNA-binding protein